MVSVYPSSVYHGSYATPEIAEIASHTQAISLFLIRAQRATAEALDGDHTNPKQPLTLGDECLLPEERRDEALSCYSSLTELPKSDVSYRICIGTGQDLH